MCGVLVGVCASGCGPPTPPQFHIEAGDIVEIRLVELERGPNMCVLKFTGRAQKAFDQMAASAAPWQVSLRFHETKMGGAHGPYDERLGLGAVCGFSGAEANALVERIRAENPAIRFSKVVDTRPL
jgi:hypothetical protein